MGEIAQKAYAAAGSARRGPGGRPRPARRARSGASKKKQDDVIDAEFEEGSS